MPTTPSPDGVPRGRLNAETSKFDEQIVNIASGEAPFSFTHLANDNIFPHLTSVTDISDKGGEAQAPEDVFDFIDEISSPFMSARAKALDLDLKVDLKS